MKHCEMSSSLRKQCWFGGKGTDQMRTSGSRAAKKKINYFHKTSDPIRPSVFLVGHVADLGPLHYPLLSHTPHSPLLYAAAIFVLQMDHCWVLVSLMLKPVILGRMAQQHSHRWTHTDCRNFRHLVPVGRQSFCGCAMCDLLCFPTT